MLSIRVHINRSRRHGFNDFSHNIDIWDTVFPRVVVADVLYDVLLFFFSDGAFPELNNVLNIGDRYLFYPGDLFRRQSRIKEEQDIIPFLPLFITHSHHQWPSCGVQTLLTCLRNETLHTSLQIIRGKETHPWGQGIRAPTFLMTTPFETRAVSHEYTECIRGLTTVEHFILKRTGLLGTP